MTTDPRRALTRLLNAFENHFDIARDGGEVDEDALVAAEEALRVAVVAVVQCHDVNVLQGETACFAADGIAALLVQPLLCYQGGEDVG